MGYIPGFSQAAFGTGLQRDTGIAQRDLARKEKELKYETTFIGLKSSKILEFKKIENVYKVTVDFVSEIITCVKDRNNQIIEGNPDIIKTVNDVWKFSKNMWSQDPTWYLVETSNK